MSKVTKSILPYYSGYKTLQSFLEENTKGSKIIKTAHEINDLLNEDGVKYVVDRSALILR